MSGDFHPWCMSTVVLPSYCHTCSRYSLSVCLFWCSRFHSGRWVICDSLSMIYWISYYLMSIFCLLNLTVLWHWWHWCVWRDPLSSAWSRPVFSYVRVDACDILHDATCVGSPCILWYLLGQFIVASRPRNHYHRSSPKVLWKWYFGNLNCWRGYASDSFVLGECRLLVSYLAYCFSMHCMGYPDNWTDYIFHLGYVCLIFLYICDGFSKLTSSYLSRFSRSYALHLPWKIYHIGRRWLWDWNAPQQSRF